MYTYERSDDRLLAIELQREIANDRLYVINNHFDSCEYKDIIKKCDLVYAERMHVGVGAVSQGVPTIFITYSRKSVGMARLVYGEEAFKDFVVNVADIGGLSKEDVNTQLNNIGRAEDILNSNLSDIINAAQSKFNELIRDLKLV